MVMSFYEDAMRSLRDMESHVVVVMIVGIRTFVSLRSGGML